VEEAMEERRKQKRILSSVFIRFAFEYAPDESNVAFTEDISPEGVKILSESLLRVDDNLELNIDVPNNPDMTIAEGSVRWIGSKKLDDITGKEVYQAGVELTYMDRQDRDYLRKFLKVRAPAAI
jgi:hypothetical protein